MRPLLAATLRALAFLTRLPPASRAFAGSHPLGLDAHAFPLAGIVAAAPSAAFVLLGDLVGLSAPTIAVAAVGLLVLVTGGLHEDGLGDVADGLGGHRPAARALEIMKDSRIGAYGALALILSLGFRIALVAELVARDPAAAALILLLVAAASRGAMAWLWSSLPSVAPGGLAGRMGRPSPRIGRIALGLGMGFLILGGLFAGGLAGMVLSPLLALLALGQFRKLLIRRLGGQTGDCLGAGQQIAEMAMLLGFALAFGISRG